MLSHVRVPKTNPEGVAEPSEPENNTRGNLILLMIAEAALSVILRHESVSVWAANLVTPLGLLGLAGQIGFGLMPLFVGDERAASPGR